MADVSPDWNDINREYMESRDQRADISEEEARARRSLEEEGPDMDVEIGPPPGLATTTTWNDNTTLVPGQIGDLNVTTEANQPAYYSYTSPAIDKEAIKEALREVLIEMREEDCNFISWLQMKYMTIPVVQKKKKRRKRNATVRLSPSGAGSAGIAVSTTGYAAGSATSSVRFTERSAEVGDAPPDQRSR